MENRLRPSYDVSLTHDQSGASVTRGYMVAEVDGAIQFQQGLIPELSDSVRNDTFSAEHRSPLVDLPADFSHFELGAGFEDAVDIGQLGFPGYNYTDGVDLSHGSRGYLGPEKQTGGSVTQAPIKFLESSFGFFCMTARYVYEWTGSWTQRLDTGGVATNTDLIEFSNSGGTYLCLGVTGQSYYLSRDGILWNQPSTAGTTSAFLSAATSTTTGATGLTPTEPASAAENHILTAIVAIDADEQIYPPAGWSEITQQTLTGLTSKVGAFWIRRGGSAPSYAFTWTSSVRASIAVAAWAGPSTVGSPFERFDSANFNINASGTSHNTGTATITWTNQMALALYGGSDDAAGGPGAWTPPSGYGERADTSFAPGVEIANDGTTSVGALSAATATSAASAVSLGILLVLKPVITGAYDVARWAIRGSSSGEPLLWAIDSYGDVRNCTDPTDKSSWSAADATQMGQSDVTIGGFEVIDNTFYLISDDGISSYDGTTTSSVWNPKALLSTSAARPTVGPDKRLYFTFQNSLFRYDPAAESIGKVWPVGPQIGNSELNGTVTAIAFDDEGNGYFALVNSGGAYRILKFDPFRQISINGEAVTPVHTLYNNSTSAVSALMVAEPSSGNFSSTNHQLVMGDGTTADYLILPKPNLRPEDDSACRFDTTADRIAYGSFINYRSQAFPKWLTRGDLEVTDADSNDTIALQYQTVGGTATTVVTANTNGRTTATLSSEVSFTKIRPVFLFNNGANTTSPTLLGGVLHAAPNAPRDRYWRFVVRIAEGQVLRNGLTTTQFDAENQVDFLMNARNEYVTFVDMRGASYNVKVLDIEPAGAKLASDGTLDELFRVTLVELVS